MQACCGPSKEAIPHYARGSKEEAYQVIGRRNHLSGAT
jgi:hypothetical protein